MPQPLLLPLVRFMAHVLLLWLKIWNVVTSLPAYLTYKVLRLLAFHTSDWIDALILIGILFPVFEHVRTVIENKKLKETNAELKANHEREVARRTIRFNRTAPNTYAEGTVVQGIHIIGKDFDMVIHGMEIGSGVRDGRCHARIRGADEWIHFGSQLVINSNDITKEVVEAGGNVDLEWGRTEASQE